MSPSSRETQATGPGGSRDSAQELTNAVLPVPAGAETRVRGPAVPPFSKRWSRVRTTVLAGGRGTVSFVDNRVGVVASFDR